MGGFKNRTLRKSVYAKVEFESECWSSLQNRPFDRKLLQIAKVQTRDFRPMAIIKWVCFTRGLGDFERQKLFLEKLLSNRCFSRFKKMSRVGDRARQIRIV